MAEKKTGNEHVGHRKRLIAKLESGALCEHEELEALLFNAVPRRNTNDLAHRLLAQFGSMNNVFSASIAQLTAVEGIGENIASYLKLVGVYVSRNGSAREKEVTFPKEYDPDFFCSFVKSAYASLPFETLEFYLLDSTGGVYKRKSFSTEELLRVSLDTESLNDFLSAEKPSGLVLVHTHPSGDMYPSKMDDFTTRRVREVARINNLLFCDHIIYSPKGVYSYRLAGRMQTAGKDLTPAMLKKYLEEKNGAQSADGKN